MPKPTTRRRFLGDAALLSTGSALLARTGPLLAQASKPAATAHFVADSSRASAPVRVPVDFVGLSYESEQLAKPDFFSAANTGLIEQFRDLAPHGVLRLGGNTSEFSWWKPTAAAQPPKRDGVHEIYGEPSAKLQYSITPEAVDNLRKFLDAAGWTCIYGLNLGTGTPETAAAEAKYAHQALGGRLKYFQLGNEVDLFPPRLRDKATWNPRTYLKQWAEFARAVTQAVPDASFGMPDVAAHIEWLPAIAEDWSSVMAGDAAPKLAMLTHHYYFSGPPSSPNANMNRMLHTDPKVLHDAAVTKAAAAKLEVPYRMTEGNTCYQGGKPGLSDVFGAALWSADYLLTLASWGYAGVNLHGGGGQEVANSLGGLLPGEKLMPDPSVPHPRPFYTPIAETNGKYVPEPVSFGMRMAGMFAGADLQLLKLDAGEVNATGYVAKREGGEVLVAVINKDTNHDLQADLSSLSGKIQKEWRLTAPGVEAHSAAFALAPSATRARGTAVTVPRASGVLLLLG